MIQQLRNSIVVKFLWGAMGLYLLNISVDAADAKPAHIPEDLSFNDQESIVEILIEKILGYEDAFKEYDDHDPKDHNGKTKVQIDLIPQPIVNSFLNGTFIETTKRKFPLYTTSLTTGHQQLYTPPPKI